jgi:AraC-like DNA-binding protein
MDAEEFRARPVGGYVARASWIYFCVNEALYGFALWGTPEAEDVSSLVRLLEAELARPPHAALVDVRRLSTVLAPSYVELAEYFRCHAAALKSVVTRSAIVKSDGLAGAVAAGFLETVPPTFSTTLFDELVPALVSLGVGDAEAVGAALDRAQAEAATTPELLRALHQWLDEHPRGGSIDDAAHDLAMGVRTLQRRLAEVSTSFADEMQRGRVRRAQKLLVETNASITTIALDVGCATPQHLSTLFRKHVGETPTEWRRRSQR